MLPARSRMALCAGASILLHALTLSAKFSYSGSLNVGATPEHIVLQAALRSGPSHFDIPADLRGPEQGSDSTVALADRPRELQTASVPGPHRDEQISTRGTPDGIHLASPEEWFSGEELDARAEPLSPPKLGYPTELAGGRTAGRVRLALFIDETGLVRKLRVVASMPENMFDSAAVRAWQDVRFSPAMKDGGPVKSRKVLDVEFTPD